MKKNIVFFCLFLGLSISGGSQMAVTDPGLTAVVGTLQMTVSQLAASEQQEEVNRQRREIEQMKKLIQSGQAFLKNASEAKQTIQILINMTCLLDEILTLQKERKKYGFQTCYGNLEFEIFQVRLTSQLAVMNGLFAEAINTTGQQKNMDWKNVTTDLSNLKDDMVQEKEKLSKDVKTLESTEVEMEENLNLVNDSWTFIGGVGK